MALEIPTNYPQCEECIKKVMGIILATQRELHGNIKCKDLDKNDKRVVSGKIFDRVSKNYLSAELICPGLLERKN